MNFLTTRVSLDFCFIEYTVIMSFSIKIAVFVSLLTLICAVRRHLSEPDTARIVQLLEDGQSQRQVAMRFEISQSVVSRIWTRFRETGRYTQRPGQGRHRMTTPQEDRYLRIIARRNRFDTARQIEMDFRRGTGVHLSDQTTRNRLHEVHLRARRPVLRPILTQMHRRARLAFAQDHVRWQLRHWRTVLFTDESRFHISTCDRRVRVWRHPGERYNDGNIIQYDRYGGGSVMVWGGICFDGRTELHVIDGGSLTAIRYRDDIVDPIIRPFAGAIGDDFVLMHDNARPHVARVVQDYMEEAGIEVMDWPTVSPDLNPIELLGFCGETHQRPRTTSTDTTRAIPGTHRGMGGHVSAYRSKTDTQHDPTLY